MANAKPPFVVHSQVSMTLTRWAEDIRTVAGNSENFVAQVIADVEALWLDSWAEVAKAKAFGSKQNPDFAGYVELVDHCQWRASNLPALCKIRGCADSLDAEIEMLKAWVLSYVGGLND